MRHAIPKWVIGYAILQFALALLFGIMAYINPANQFPDIGGNDAAFAIGLYANRNLGVSVALIVALLLRNRNMLIAIFIARFATDLFDFLLAVFGTGVDDGGALIGQLIFFAIVLWIPEVLAVRTLWNQEQTGE